MVNEPMQAQENDLDGLIAFDMSMSGLDATMFLPDRSTQGVDPSLQLDDITAIYTLKVGRGFAMTIREENRSLDGIKADWERDMVWRHEIISEDAETIIVKRSLPGGDMEHYHFVMSKPSDQAPILMRSDAMQEFSLSQVERMLNSARTFQWNTEPIALVQH